MSGAYADGCSSCGMARGLHQPPPRSSPTTTTCSSPKFELRRESRADSADDSALTLFSLHKAMASQSPSAAQPEKALKATTIVRKAARSRPLIARPDSTINHDSSAAAYMHMQEQGSGGRIIMTSSTSGLIGNFGQTNYGAAKAGIAGFMRCLALEGARAGITVNVLAPNAYSRMTAELFPEGSEVLYAAEKVSPAIAWLCSDEAEAITGRQFVISGNRVSLLYQAYETIADRDGKEGKWRAKDVSVLQERMDQELCQFLGGEFSVRGNEEMNEHACVARLGEAVMVHSAWLRCVKSCPTS